MMKELLAGLALVLACSLTVEGLARVSLQSTEADVPKKNESRTVMKLNRPKWKQHSKYNIEDGSGIVRAISSPLNLNTISLSVIGTSGSLVNHFEGPGMAGINVCNRTETTTKQESGGMGSSLQCLWLSEGTRCTSTVSDGKTTNTTTTHYECCPGFDKVPGGRDCLIEISNKNLKEALIEEGRQEFVKAFDSFNLTATYLTNTDGKFTIFAPTTESLNEFKSNLESSNDIDNAVEITPDLLDTAKHIRGRLVSHVVPGVVKDFSLFRTTSLKTAHRDGVIFVNKHFQKDGQVSTKANCIAVTSSKMVSNGMIYNIDGFLRSTELSLVQYLETRKDVGIFKSILEKANLSLSIDQPLTVAVPTDQAFAKHPSLVQELEKLSDRCLRGLVLNHFFYDVSCTSDAPQELRSAMKSGLLMKAEDDGVVKIDKASVTELDILTSNGVVHIIDDVLIPITLLSAPEFAKKVGAGKFAEMLESTGFEPLDDTTFTLVIPTDSAVEKYLKEESHMPVDKLVDFHTLPKLSGLTKTSRVETADEGHSMLVRTYRQLFETLVTLQCIPLTTLNSFHKTCTFHPYIVEQVLTPAEHTVLELIKREDDLSRFYSLIKLTNMEEALDSRDKIVTVFAPTNEEMERLSDETQESLLNGSAAMKRFVEKHIFDDLQCLLMQNNEIKNHAGETILFSVNRRHASIGNVPLKTGKMGIMATNGVLHQIKGHIHPKPILSFRPGFSLLMLDDPFWNPFSALCWSDDDDLTCDDFEKKKKK